MDFKILYDDMMYVVSCPNPLNIFSITDVVPFQIAAIVGARMGTGRE